MENEITIRIREMQQVLVEKNLICASFKTIDRISIKESLLALKIVKELGATDLFIESLKPVADGYWPITRSELTWLMKKFVFNCILIQSRIWLITTKKYILQDDLFFFNQRYINPEYP